MKDYAPNIIQHVWVPDYFFDLARNLAPNVIIKPFAKQKQYNDKLTTVKMSCKEHTSIATHLIDFAFHVFVDKQVEDKHKNYLPLNVNNINIDKFNLPEKYIVLTVGYTAGVREMLPNIANEIINWCDVNNLNVVILGSHSALTGHGHNIKGTFKEEILFDKTINLVNNTTLLEAGKIMSGAQCVVGLDNGLLHLAGTTDVPIVAGFSTVEPRLRLPYRHDTLGWNCYTAVPDEAIECRFCQSKMIHVYNFDFRNCYYGDKVCLPTITSQKYIDHIKKIVAL